MLKPIRPTGLLAAAIASVALTIALENVVRFIFGNDLRGYDLPIQRDWRILDIRIGPQQVENFAVAVLAMAVVFLFLAFTRTGKDTSALSVKRSSPLPRLTFSSVVRAIPGARASNRPVHLPSFFST